MPAVAAPAMPPADGLGAVPAAGQPGEFADHGIWPCGTRLADELLGLDSAWFSQDGGLPAQCAGPELALLLPDAHDLARLDDEQLTGVARCWRQLSSWVAAMEHAAVGELAGRRIAEAKSAGARESEAGRYAAAEVAAALTLTRYSAENLVERALALADLPATFGALARGEIDVPKALVILAGVSSLDGELARRVEDQVLSKAPAQTTGELRKAVARAVIAADPAAADRRCEQAQKSARVERWAELAGTAALAGRDLPAADVLAADNRINAIAAALKADGAPGSMDQLRAEVYVGLLLDRPVAAASDADPAEDGRPAQSAVPAERAAPAEDAGLAETAARAERAVPAEDVGSAEDAGAAATMAPADGVPVGLRRVPAGLSGPAIQTVRGVAGSVNPRHSLAGAVNITVPLRSLLGLSGQPGEVAGFGPVSPSTLDELLLAARGSPAVRWCVTVTNDHGEATGHGCASRGLTPARPGAGWEFTVKVSALPAGACQHRRQSGGYKPPPTLRHLIEIRHKTCVFPGCGRPARQCDQDHTIPYDQGGLTCECNLAPLCRLHHEIKQARGWWLEQPAPGLLNWTTPAGWEYTITPAAHPA